MKKSPQQRENEESLAGIQADLTMCEDIISHIEFIYVGDITPPRLRNAYNEGLMWREKARKELEGGTLTRAQSYAHLACGFMRQIEGELFPDMPFRSRIL